MDSGPQHTHTGVLAAGLLWLNPRALEDLQNSRILEKHSKWERYQKAGERQIAPSFQQHGVDFTKQNTEFELEDSKDSKN